MTKEQALIDAQARADNTGLTWHVIAINAVPIWPFKAIGRTYDTVSEHHVINNNHLYKSGKLESIQKFEPATIPE